MTDTLLIIGSTVFLAWASWVSVSIIQGGKQIAKNDQMHADMGEIKTGIEKLNKRFDIFIKQELDELKEITGK